MLIITILVGGIQIAFSIGKLAGHGVGATMSWAQGVVKRIPIVPYGKGKGVGGLRWGSAAGVESGAKTLWGVAAKKGFLGFGGSERAKREADSIATRLGLKLGYKRTDLAGLGQKTEKSAVDAKVGELKGAIDAGTLKLDDILKEIESGKDLITLGGRINTETIAKYALAADKGKLTADQLKTLAETVGKENPLIMKDIGESLVKNNFSGWSEEDIQKIVKPAPDGSVFGGDGGNKVRAQAYEWLASEEGKRRMGSAVDGEGNARVDVEVMKSAVLTMGHNSTEGRKHMRDMATIRPELVVEYRTNVQVQRKNGIEKFYVDGKEFNTRAEADVELATRQAPGGDLTKEKVWKDILETKSGKEIAEFSDITWKIPEFKQELDKRILDMQERGKAKGTNVGTGVQFRQDLMTGLRNNPKYSEKLTEFLRPNSAGYDPTALVSEFASLRAKQSRMKERNISDTAQAMVDLRTDLASVISRMRAAKLNSDLYAE